MNWSVDQDCKGMQAGEGSDSVYVCGMYEVGQCRTENARHCSRMQLCGWVGEGGGTSEEREGSGRATSETAGLWDDLTVLCMGRRGDTQR